MDASQSAGRRAFVSGCFDMLHSGHVEFLQRAAAYGELHVAIGADRTVFALKGREPVNTEDERRFMVENVACVHHAFVSRGSGMLDFVEELKEIQPQTFVVNEDGNTPAKRKLCETLGIAYVVLQRLPHGGLTPRSTTALRQVQQMPYRIDLCGGWLDQPFVSQHHPGCVITASLEPVLEFNERSGMATSTRRTAVKLWKNKLPVGDPERTAWTLFCCDNPPGKTPISGSQDAIGIVFAGLARAHYGGQYWPTRIDHEKNEDLLRFLEQHLSLIPLGPREDSFDVLQDTRIDRDRARALAVATDACWDAIQRQDAPALGSAMTAGFEAQVAMFPGMRTPVVAETIETVRGRVQGWKVSGAGGGGYLVTVSDQPLADTIACTIRREWD
jgi:cytidyltransferase-like protein